MDSHSAHIISFALDVGMQEVGWLIGAAEEKALAATSKRLSCHYVELTKIREQFSATSENLHQLADRVNEIATDIQDIEQQIDVRENDQSIHCALAASSLSAEAKIARGNNLV